MSPSSVVTNTGGNTPWNSIVASGSTLFWAFNLPSDGHPSQTDIEWCPTSGCANPSFVDVGAGPGGLAVDSSTVYFSGRNASSKAAIMMCTPSSGNCTSPTQYAVSASTYLYALGALYWSDPFQVSSCALGMPCSSPSQVAFSDTPTVLTADSSNVYWSDTSGIKQCPRAGCGSASPIALAGGQQNANSIVSDGTHVYWANGSSILRAQVGVMNSATAIAQNQNGAATVGVGNVGVYWSVSAGPVMMLAK
jgi:hypothetical protein